MTESGDGDGAARSPLEIAEHGLIGDLRSAALVGADGTIDWFCPERFDRSAVFAALLDADEDRAGAWRIEPREPGTRTTQFYFPDSNVLVTRFMSERGVVEVQDFMPLGDGQRIVRRLVCVRGSMALRTRLRARFDFGREAHSTRRRDEGVVLSAADADLKLTLFAAVPLATEAGDVSAEVELREGESSTFVLHVGEVGDREAHRPEASARAFERTVSYWREWLSTSTYTGRWREMVHRSALTLKLLTYGPSGAIVAAPTTSLPETLGGDRNWDYRFVWMRDAAFTVYALIRLGFTAEAEAFNGWTAERMRECGEPGENGPLQAMYRVDGSPELPEEEVEGLAGYAGSAPVRAGNGAAGQLQLDIYGELIDSIYLADKYGTPISHADWEDLCRIVEWLRENWDRPDAGIWESRAGERDHTFSRLMCWVAIERMIRMARRRGLPGDIVAWTAARDDIYAQIHERGWSDERGAFVGRLGDGVLDSSLLLAPMVKFAAPRDPRFLATLTAIEERLVSDSLVYRYDPAESTDGLEGDEGTFSICSFWYVEALTRAGRLEDARLALEKMFTYANHLGLYAEQISPSGQQLGNFPQAFTHFSLISAAYNLDRALDE